jgi:hypothetical protein
MVRSIYQDLLRALKEKIHLSRYRAVTAANRRLLLVYWEIGTAIHEMEKDAGWGAKMNERDLEKALVRHIQKFLLELGRGFAYVGNQYNLQVQDDHYFLDLLFFSYNLNCFVIFELKVGDFKLSRALPKQLKGEIPTVAELEKELEDKTDELKRPKASIKPLFERLIVRLEEYSDFFLETKHTWYFDNSVAQSLKELEHMLAHREETDLVNKIGFVAWFKAFTPAGVETFNAFINLFVKLDERWYCCTLSSDQPKMIKKKPYTPYYLPQDIDEICDLACDQLMDQIEPSLTS